MSRVSVYGSRKENTNPKIYPIDDVLHKIQTSDVLKDLTRKVRSGELDKDSLPFVLISGEFSKSGRQDSDLIKHSGYVFLDFDKVNDIPSKISELKLLDYIKAVWVSSTGTGVHSVASISLEHSHRDHYRALLEEHPDADVKCINESRGCYLPYDPDVFINPVPVPFDKGKKADVPEPKTLGEISREITPDIQHVKVPLLMVRNAVSGERHDKTIKAAKLMGGYVSEGYIKYDDGFKMLEAEAEKNSPEEIDDRRKAIRDGMDYGMKFPVSPRVARELKELETKEKRRLGKIYYTLADVKDKLDDLYQNGLQRGVDVGYESAKEYCSLLPGRTTFIYAAPFSGKTELWLDWLINISEQYGWKHAILTPETGDPAEIYAELIAKAARQDFFGDYNNKMDEATRKEAERFIDRHFIVIDPSDNKFTEEDFIDTLIVIEAKYKIKINTATIDPWNHLGSDKRGMSRDIELEERLIYVSKMARANDIHLGILTHVRDQKEASTGKNGEGQRYYPLPFARDIAQGQGWYRIGLQMISLWRPVDVHNDPLPKTVLMGMAGDGDFEKNEIVVSVQKSKPKGIGKVGRFSLYYDAKKHRYYELIDGARRYASYVKEEEVKLSNDFNLPMDLSEVPF